MALADEVEVRYAASLLVELTNHGDTAATTINATRMAAAAADAAARFEKRTGSVFDLTDAAHVDAAVEGVMTVLHERARQADEAARHREAFLGLCEDIAVTTGGRARILPQTNSQLTPSEEVPEGGSVRPDFDRGNLGIFLRPPHGSTSEDE